MEQHEIGSDKVNSIIPESEIAELIQEQLLFTKSIYARLPIGIEIYDAKGVLRSINDHALQMYGVSDSTNVVNIVNLFNSPYVNADLKAKIQSGDDIVLEFEYDFERINNNAYFASSNRNTMIYEAQVIPIRGRSGAIIGHILLAKDVTAVREVEYRTEETKKNLEMAMEAADMSSWVFDVSKKVFSVVYGDALPKESLTWTELLSKLHPQDQLPLMQLFPQLINKEVPQGQLTVLYIMKKRSSIAIMNGECACRLSI